MVNPIVKDDSNGMKNRDVTDARAAVRPVVEEVAFWLASLPLSVRGLGLQKARTDFERCFLMGGIDPGKDAGARRTVALVMRSICLLLRDIDRSSDKMAS
jgi:hypothetical protein